MVTVLVVFGFFSILVREQEESEQLLSRASAVREIHERNPSQIHEEPAGKIPHAASVSLPSLAVFCIGKEHDPSIDQVVKRFLKPASDYGDGGVGAEAEFHVMLYLYDEHVFPSLSAWHKDPRITIVYEPKHLLKPEFAARFLVPTVTAPHEFVFLWDGDALLTSGWNPHSYVRVAREHQLDVSQPALDWGSQHSFDFNAVGQLDKQAPFTPSLFAELGFVVFERRTWDRVRENVLAHHPFKYWCFDALPFQCLPGVRARNVGVVNQPITHPHGKHLLGIQTAAPDPVVRAHIDTEIAFARKLVACSNCCEFVRKRTDKSNNNGCFPIGHTCPVVNDQVCQALNLTFYY
ncbi:MAG: DUF707 domain-containing protein [archaeon]|nr:DUF707 domain-containing protein [archaeon]